MGTVAVWVVIAAIVIAVVVVQRRIAKKRREEMLAWAARHGWSYTDQDDSYTGRFQGGPFGKGDRRRARNVVTGTYDGRPVVAFDYSYDTESTDSKGNRHRTTHRFAIAALGLPCSVPDLEVNRENLFSSLGRALGFHDIEFENEEFNKEFKVQAQDRRFAYDVLHPRMMEWMLRTPGPSWSIERADLLCWVSGRGRPAEIESRLGYLAQVVAQIPGFVWDRPATP